MLSERGNDGIARSAERWFKRHNPKSPAQGGARKSRAAKAGDWLDTARQAWEQTANRALKQAGRAERIDGRSLADRRDAAHREGNLERAAELSREPNVHLGPQAVTPERQKRGTDATGPRAEHAERSDLLHEPPEAADSSEPAGLRFRVAGISPKGPDACAQYAPRVGTERPLPDCHRRRHVSRDSGLEGVDGALRMLAEPPVFVHLFRDIVYASTSGHSLHIGARRTSSPLAFPWPKYSRLDVGSRQACRARGELASRGAVARLRYNQ